MAARNLGSLGTTEDRKYPDANLRGKPQLCIRHDSETTTYVSITGNSKTLRQSESMHKWWHSLYTRIVLQKPSTRIVLACVFCEADTLMELDLLNIYWGKCLNNKQRETEKGGLACRPEAVMTL